MTGFEFPISTRLAGVGSSPVRDLLAVLSRKDVISFAGGIPDASLFAADELRESYSAVLTQMPERALQYASTEGEPELREQAAARLDRHLPTQADQIQVTAGSQEGLYLVAQALVDDGDVVLVEEPTYLAAVQAFTLAGARLVSVPSNDGGVIPDQLEKLIAHHRPKFVYLIPSFQNPSGRVMDQERRRQVAEVLLRTATVLVEDDPYGELCFEGEPLAPIAAVDGMAAQTVLLNSLSKIVAPGMRIGWVRADSSFLPTVAIAKQAVGLQSAVTDQLAAAWYLAHHDLDAHIAKVRAVYRQRCGAMLQALAQEIPRAEVNRPRGGLFLWARLEGVDTAQLLPRALEKGVAFVPGAPFFATGPDHATMRLSFATNDIPVIHDGVRRLARALAEHSAH